MSLGGSLTGNDEKATTTTMKNKVNENLNFLLPATPGTTTPPPQVCHPLQQSKSEHLLHHEKNLKGLLLLAPRNEQQNNNNSNSDVEHMLLETQSLPVWMPSVVTSTTVVNANVKQNFASKISNPSLQQLRLDIAKLDGVETGEQSVTTGFSFWSLEFFRRLLKTHPSFIMFISFSSMSEVLLQRSFWSRSLWLLTLTHTFLFESESLWKKEWQAIFQLSLKDFSRVLRVQI
jgi:hypothetical protein